MHVYHKRDSKHEVNPFQFKCSQPTRDHSLDVAMPHNMNWLPKWFNPNYPELLNSFQEQAGVQFNCRAPSTATLPKSSSNPSPLELFNQKQAQYPKVSNFIEIDTLSVSLHKLLPLHNTFYFNLFGHKTKLFNTKQSLIKSTCQIRHQR